MHQSLANKVGDAYDTPHHLGSDGACGNGNGIYRIATGGVSRTYWRGGQIHSHSRATVVVDGGVVDDRRGAFDGNATAVLDG